MIEADSILLCGMDSLITFVDDTYYIYYTYGLVCKGFLEAFLGTEYVFYFRCVIKSLLDIDWAGKKDDTKEFVHVLNDLSFLGLYINIISIRYCLALRQTEFLQITRTRAVFGRGHATFWWEDGM